MQEAWKEGRTGAASLCYLNLTEAEIARIAPLHARVGIRATLVVAPGCPVPPLLAERNWDLASGSVHADNEDDLPPEETRTRILDTTTAPPLGSRGVVVGTTPGMIAREAPRPETPLPSYLTGEDPRLLRAAIERVVVGGAWAIWRIPVDTLRGWSDEGVTDLLRWLGDHHARIWCAPVRDIARWLWAPADST